MTTADGTQYVKLDDLEGEGRPTSSAFGGGRAETV